MAIEYERKFSATPTQLEKAHAYLQAAWHTVTMETTYFDTADGSLSARKWMLRRRLENGQPVCTLKTPAGDARNEWECSGEVNITELCKLGAPRELLSLTQNGVQPICGAAFTRRAATGSVEGAEVEVALDEGILFAGERREPLCELEVELKSGSHEAADAFAEALAERLGLRELKDSKFKRARALCSS